ncbi:MAG: hypothetical protein FWH33_00045 [Oscillospiraceae bacterium]|nr:hypothetical protein [Oscillospiraceae bacterium]
MIDRERWATLSIVEQMGNIGSEVGRAIASRDNPARRDGAIDRALDLFAATAECHSGARLREILRSRDEFLRLFFGDSTDYDGVERYFHHFAIAARRGR